MEAYPHSSLIVKPSFIYGGSDFALTPPRVASGYGSAIEVLPRLSSACLSNIKANLHGVSDSGIMVLSSSLLPCYCPGTVCRVSSLRPPYMRLPMSCLDRLLSPWSHRCVITTRRHPAACFMAQFS